jgi:CheY-like chemotaxis protein
MNELYGVLLCDDLIFTSRICGEAKALGLALRAVKTPADLRRFCEQSWPRCVILDLHAPGLSIDELVRELTAREPRPFIVGYGSHVDTLTLKKARAAGCNIVWPRSKFVEELAVALPAWFKPTETTP